MKFRLTIKLGNDAMQSADDIAAALVRTAARVARRGEAIQGDSGVIMDDNGNRVGTWELDAE